MTPNTRQGKGRKTSRQAGAPPPQLPIDPAAEARPGDDERFRIISEHTSDFAYAFAVAPDGTAALEWVTEAFFRTTGYQPDEVSRPGKWITFLPPDAVDTVMARLQRVLAGETDEGEIRITTKSGAVRWLDVHNWPVYDQAHERVVRFYGAARDVTERRQAEAALRESERLYRTLVESAQDAIFIVNRDGRLEYVNQAAARVLGRTSEEVVGKPPAEFFGAGAFARQQSNLQAVFESGRAARFLGDTWIGDQQLWQETSLIPLQGEQRAVRAIMGIARDVTDRVRAQEARRESEERYRTLAESSPDAIYIINNAGIVEYVNRAAAALVGREPADIAGRPPEACFAPGTFSRQAQNLERVRQSGQPLVAENCNTIGGRQVWQDTLLVPLQDKDGQVRAIMGVSRDITARKEAEEALRRSEERYRAVSELTSDFAFAIRIGAGAVALEWITDAIARITGLTMDEIRTRGSWQHFVHADDLPLVRELLATLRRGQPLEQQVRLITKAGQIRWVQAYAVPVRDPGSGEFVRAYGAAKDITAQKAAEQALQQSEHQYRTTINALHDMIHVVDRDLRVILCNKAMTEWLAEAQMDTSVIGRTVFETFPFLPGCVRDEYLRVFETGEMLLTEEITRIGERELVTETRKLPVLEEGKVARVITVIHDITERKRAEEKLQQSEARYRALIETSPDAITLADMEGRILMVNRRGAEIQGVADPAELIGKQVFEMVAPDEREIALAKTREVLKTGFIQGLEYNVLRRDGTYHPVELTASLLRDAQGRPQAFIGVTRDISERKRAEHALRESEERYRRLVETSPDGITLTDLEGHILMTNQRGAEIHGYAHPAEMVGANAFDLALLGDREAAVANLQRTLESGQIHGVEYTVRRKDGTLCPIELTAALIRDAQGRPQSFIGLTRDITERRRAEAALWQTKMVVEHSPVILYRMRNEAGWPFEFISENVSQLGYTAAEILSGQVTFTMLVHPDDVLQVVGEMEDHAERGPDTFRRSYRVILANKRTAWLEDRVVVVRAPDGRATHLQGILLDVTENRQLEEQFRQAQKMETVGRLAGGVAHDFNNFLTAIRGYAALVYDAMRPEDPVRGDIEQVLKAAERAASLTGQLLAFSRRQIIELRPVNVNDLVMETEKMLHRLIGEDIDLVLDMTSGLELTRADPGQLAQALVNLVVNARDAMPDGGMLTIATARLALPQESVEEHPGVPPGDYITLAVSDTGVGMAPEVKAHLFEPFFTTKEAGRGTGLGLATVYGIVRQHQGHIVVRSAAGCGTTVRLYLPHSPAGAQPAPRHRSAEPLPRGCETVLVVEDEPAVRALIVRVLRSLGYNVLEAGEGNAAIQVAREHEGKIHLLLTDVVMPQMDGRMLSSLLQDAYEGLRVLYVSGYATDVLAHYGVLEEDVSLLHKPFTGSALAGKVREVLDAAGQSQEAGQ